MRELIKGFVVAFLLLLTSLVSLSISSMYAPVLNLPFETRNHEIIVLEKGISAQDYAIQKNEEWKRRVDELKKKDRDKSFNQQTYTLKKYSIFLCLVIWPPIIYLFNLGLKSTVIAIVICLILYISGLLVWFELFAIVLLLYLIFLIRTYRKRQRIKEK